jgi:hypothetical protein
MSSLSDGAASVFVEAIRISTLDTQGYVDPGANTFATANGVKLSINPVVESGDDIAIKNANGDLPVLARHPDMVKYHTVQIELANPDPSLEAALSGGLVYTDNSSALGTPTGLAVIPETTGGTLAAAIYGYRASQYSSNGETLAENTVAGTVASGTTGQVVVQCPTLVTAALGARIYGRTQGEEQYIGQLPNIGSQVTSAASGTGVVTSLTVTALTSPIPVGTQFILSTDTNTTKIIFTTIAYAPIGIVTLPVSASASVTTTIPTAGTLIPVLVDTGAITPSGALPKVDNSAGHGLMGYQEPTLGIVGNPNGIAIEAFSAAYKNGIQDPILPWFRHVLPKVRGMHRLQRTLTNANAETVYEGQAFGNLNFGSGGFGDIPYDTTKAYQYFRVGPNLAPVGSAAPVAIPALY